MEVRGERIVILTLWHGSKTGLRGLIRPISRMDDNNEYIPHDFGIGFYAGTKLMSAVDWALNGTRDATISKIELPNINTILNSDCKVHVFKQNIDAVIDWALYVAYNRNYFSEHTPIQQKNIIKRRELEDLYPMTFSYFSKLDECDIIIGSIADDRMQYAYDAFISEWLGIRGLSKALKAASLGTQIVFKTQRACNVLNRLSIIKTVSLNYFLKTNPAYKNKTYLQIKAERARRERDMRDRVTLINRLYKKDSSDRYIYDLLKEKENSIKQMLEANDFNSFWNNPKDLDPRELGRE